MFGRRYFGARYFGPRYFGDGGDIEPPEEEDDMLLPPIRRWLTEHADCAAFLGSPPRAYRHGRAPQDRPKLPYVTWFVVLGEPENNLSSLPTVDRLSTQVDCWANDDDEIEEMAECVRDAIEPHAHMTGLIIDARDEQTKRFRIGMLFDVWLDRPA